MNEIISFIALHVHNTTLIYCMLHDVQVQKNRRNKFRYNLMRQQWQTHRRYACIFFICFIFIVHCDDGDGDDGRRAVAAGAGGNGEVNRPSGIAVSSGQIRAYNSWVMRGVQSTSGVYFLIFFLPHSE